MTALACFEDEEESNEIQFVVILEHYFAVEHLTVVCVFCVSVFVCLCRCNVFIVCVILYLIVGVCVDMYVCSTALLFTCVKYQQK